MRDIEITEIINDIVRPSIGNVLDLEDKLNSALMIIKRASANSCCLCCDKCLACDARELLREMKVEEI